MAWAWQTRANLPSLGNDMRAAAYAYAHERMPRLLRRRRPRADCVVHYRLGDVLINEDYRLISPVSIARAVASITPKPKRIEILGAGLEFECAPRRAWGLSVWRGRGMRLTRRGGRCEQASSIS